MSLFAPALLYNRTFLYEHYKTLSWAYSKTMFKMQWLSIITIE